MADSAEGLIQRVEGAASQNLLDYVSVFQETNPDPKAAAISCAGGAAAFTAADSPLTTVKGAGPEIPDCDIDQANAFFRSCGAVRVTFELAPWVTPSSKERLTRRGFKVAGTESVVVHHLLGQVSPSCYSITIMDAQHWAVLMREVSELPDVPLWFRLFRVAALLPGAVNLGAQDDSLRWIGCAQMVPTAGVAIFGNDNTLPAARGRGVQTALIHERINRATALGLSCAAAEVAPRSISERNYLRCGFRLAYVRTHCSLNIG